MTLHCVVLAAGQGTRMKSRRPKVLHRVAGRPMLGCVLAAVERLGIARPLVVVGFGADEVKREIGPSVEYVLQAEQRGTGHAVMQARPLLERLQGDLLVVYGDTPLLRTETLAQLARFHQEEGAQATVLTAILPDPTGYGRIIRKAETGEVLRIVEEKDATPVEKAFREINTGIYCFDLPMLLAVLDRLQPNNAQGEYYLTDAIALIREAGGKVAALAAAEPVEVQGVNSREQLAGVEAELRAAKNRELMAAGVTLMDPRSTFIDLDVQVGRDTIIYPFTWLEGATRVGEECVLGPSTRIIDSVLGDGVTVEQSVLREAEVASGVSIGPFAYLRPGARIAEGAKVGDFVEIKNSRVGAGTKVPHHSYIGDAELGAGVNIGAGTITCNYDGERKHKTVVGDGCFIGANTNLVAPVTVADGAYVASGSTITSDVPAGALGVARGRQRNVEGWVARRRNAPGALEPGGTGPGAGEGED
ncbi:MAG: bifunctional UDP-N-acetylglucosamine diphosphorylase/glucosamine-1-phosphate N-acetyltransferase GlmU [Chitinophagales bacterium]